MKRCFLPGKFFIFLAGISISTYTFSQENFLPGYAIKNNGDTIKGYIDYRNWGVNPKKIDFRSEINSGTVTYKPTEIKEFNVIDETYAGGIVEVENTPVEISKLDHDSKSKITVDTVFLQSLVKGRKGLYYYRNNNGRENFYIKKDDGFELLIYKKYLIRQGTTDLIAEKKTYIGQLNLYLNDCSSIKGKVENSSYDQSDLIRLFQDYYKCTSSDIVFQRQGERVRFEIGILAGTSLTKLKFNSSDPAYDYLGNTDYKLSTDFSGGMLFDLVLPRNQGKVSIHNEIIFSMYKTTGKYEFLDYNDVYKVMSTEFDYSYVKIINLLRYRFLIGNISWFFNGGISTGIRVSETQYIKKEFTTTYSGTSVFEGSPFPQTKSYEQGYILGTGIKINKLSFETRIEKGDGMINVPKINAWATRYYFILSYHFK